MVFKLDDALRQRCMDNCMSNEILVIPQSSVDVGQHDYLTLKARTHWERSGLRVPFEQSAMAVKFPGPDDCRSKVDEFLDSPRAFMRNMVFRGCLAVDISDYCSARARESSYFRELRSFLASSKGIVFILLARSDRKSDVADLVRSLDDSIQLRQVFLSRPSTDRLVEYTNEALGRQFREADLERLFRSRRDFQTAERFIKYVKESPAEDPVDSIFSYLSTYGTQAAGRSEMGY